MYILETLTGIAQPCVKCEKITNCTNTNLLVIFHHWNSFLKKIHEKNLIKCSTSGDDDMILFESMSCPCIHYAIIIIQCDSETIYFASSFEAKNNNNLQTHTLFSDSFRIERRKKITCVSFPLFFYLLIAKKRIKKIIINFLLLLLSLQNVLQTTSK